MNRYDIIKKIQENENSCIEQVQDQVTGKFCVRKSVKKDAPYLIVHQFRVEVDVLSSLHHPQIPEIMNVYSDDENLYLIESYIPGNDFEFLLKHSFFKVRFFRTRYMMELIQILSQVHEIGYLYIDIKPSNLLLYKNHVHLIDFNACIPIHSTQAVFASKENASKELYFTVSKEESTDVYSFGQLVKKLYPLSLYFFTRKCIKSNVSKRYKNWKIMKKAFVFHVWVRRVFCVFLFILSVFFTSTQMKSPEVNPFTMYMNNPTTTTFFNAYHETFSEFQGTYVEKVQMNLYQWIEGDWIQDELWNDSFVCKYLLIQSIQSKNPLL